MLKIISRASFKSEEFKAYFRIYNDPQNNPWMHYARRVPEAFYSIFLNQSKVGKVFLYLNENGQAIGICRIMIDATGPYRHVARIASVCIDPQYKNQGHGKKLLDELKVYITENYPDVARLELTFEMDNPVAMLGKVYDKAGFRREAYFSDWFRSSDDLYQATKHPWYSGEYFSGMILSERVRTEKYTAAPNLTYNETVKQPLQTNNHILQKCTISDTDSLNKFYANRMTGLAFYSDQERALLLKNMIVAGRFFVVRDSAGVIVAACEVDAKPVGLEQLAVVQNLVAENEKAATQLFYQLTKHYQDLNNGIKRLEVVVPAENASLIKGLQASGFEYTGTQVYRFQDLSGNFIDEHFFEYSLFSLKDAIDCCTRRKQAEIKLIGTNEQFYMPLPLYFLSNLHDALEGMKNTNNLTLVEQQIIFKIVRIVCTQDCHQANERIKQLEALKPANPLIKEIQDMCMQQLKEIQETQAKWIIPHKNRPSEKTIENSPKLKI